MDQEPEEDSSIEAIAFGMIGQADRLSKSARETQQALAEQIEELGELQEWAQATALKLQQRAEAVVKDLEAERAQMQGVLRAFQLNAVQAVHDAVRNQSGEIERQTVQALAQPLFDIQQAAGQVRQNVKNSNWLLVGGIFVAGMMIGLFAGYFFVMRAQNRMGDQLDRIEQVWSAPAQPVPVVPDPHVSVRKGKGK